MKGKGGEEERALFCGREGKGTSLESCKEGGWGGRSGAGVKKAKGKGRRRGGRERGGKGREGGGKEVEVVGRNKRKRLSTSVNTPFSLSGTHSSFLAQFKFSSQKPRPLLKKTELGLKREAKGRVEIESSVLGLRREKGKKDRRV